MGFLKKLFGQNNKKVQTGGKKSQGDAAVRSRPDFPTGKNHIDDPDIKTIPDLGKWYPLPSGFTYRVGEDGSPYIERQTDRMTFHFLIEADMLTFNEKTTRSDGKTVFNTTEVFKAGS